MSTENREYERYSVDVSAEIAISGRIYQAATDNLSKGGVAVQTDAPLTEKQVIDLSLFLTEDGIESADEEPVLTRAQVRWIKPGTEGRRSVGLQFAKLAPDRAESLSHFLARLAG